MNRRTCLTVFAMLALAGAALAAPKPDLWPRWEAHNPASTAPSEAGVLEHLRTYAEAPLAEALRGFGGNVSYEYAWGLNE